MPLILFCLSFLLVPSRVSLMRLSFIHHQLLVLLPWQVLIDIFKGFPLVYFNPYYFIYAILFSLPWPSCTVWINLLLLLQEVIRIDRNKWESLEYIYQHLPVSNAYFYFFIHGKKDVKIIQDNSDETESMLWNTKFTD